MLRSLLGVQLRDEISVQKIREQDDSRDIGWTVKRLKLGYAGPGARLASGTKNWSEGMQEV